MLHTTLYEFTCEHYRIGKDLKENAILITHYTACDKECMPPPTSRGLPP